MTEQAITTTNKGTKAIAKKGGSKDLSDYLRSPAVLAKLKEVGDKVLTPDNLVRMTLTAASRTPELLECSQVSILRAMLDAATLKIAPGGRGRGYLVPRKNNKNNTMECHFDPGWQGMLDIARRSKQIKSIDAHVIYEGEEFELEYGLNERFTHKPDLSLAGGNVIASYAVAHLMNGGHQLVIVPRRDLDKIRTGKGVAQNGPWATWFDEMAKKTAIRRLCKFLPYEPELQETLEALDAVDGDDIIEVEQEQAPVESRTKRLADKVRARAMPAADMGLDEDDEAGDTTTEADADGRIDGGGREPGEEG